MNLEEFDTIASKVPGLERVLHTTKTQKIERWQVGDSVIAWHRPLSKKDSDALRANDTQRSAGVFAGEVVAIHVADEGEKIAYINADSKTCFDSPHFRGYPAVLIDLQNADPELVFELLREGCERVVSS